MDWRTRRESVVDNGDQLLKVQQKTTTELDEARNARYAKEGEVSILRKSIEKVCTYPCLGLGNYKTHRLRKTMRQKWHAYRQRKWKRRSCRCSSGRKCATNSRG